MVEKILVTGGKGFIGSHLIDKLIELGYETYSFDNSQPGFGNHHLNPKAHLISGDLRNYGQIDFALTNVDYCVHLGAISHVKLCRENPKLAYDVNVGGTINVLEACRKHNIKRVVCASSDHIYGRNPNIPVKETNKFEAANESDIYGLTKLFQLRLCQLYYKQYGLSVVITASGNVFSERQSKPNIFPNFVDAALKNESIIIHNSGNQSRDFYFIDNLINAYHKCLITPNIDGELFNIGSGQEISVNFIAKKILEFIPESRSKIIHINNKKDNAMNKMCLDTQKAQKILNWNIIIPFEEGLKIAIEKWKIKK